MPPKPVKTPFKVILVGNSGVGKSNLLSVLATGEFSEEFKSTIGVEFVTKSLPVGDVSLKAQIWDTAGQERFSTMLGTYYRKSKGAVLVYDITDQRSFEAVERWRNELLRHADQQVSLLLCGNKSDLESSRVVSKADGEAYAEQNDMIFFETSAKKNSNILECFTALMSAIYDVHQGKGQAQGGNAPQESGNPAPSKQSASGEGVRDTPIINLTDRSDGYNEETATPKKGCC